MCQLCAFAGAVDPKMLLVQGTLLSDNYNGSNNLQLLPITYISSQWKVSIEISNLQKCTKILSIISVTILLYQSNQIEREISKIMKSCLELTQLKE